MNKNNTTVTYADAMTLIEAFAAKASANGPFVSTSMGFVNAAATCGAKIVPVSPGSTAIAAIVLLVESLDTFEDDGSAIVFQTVVSGLSANTDLEWHAMSTVLQCECELDYNCVLHADRAFTAIEEIADRAANADGYYDMVPAHLQ